MFVDKVGKYSINNTSKRNIVARDNLEFRQEKHQELISFLADHGFEVNISKSSKSNLIIIDNDDNNVQRRVGKLERAAALIADHFDKVSAKYDKTLTNKSSIGAVVVSWPAATINIVCKPTSQGRGNNVDDAREVCVGLMARVIASNPKCENKENFDLRMAEIEKICNNPSKFGCYASNKFKWDKVVSYLSDLEKHNTAFHCGKTVVNLFDNELKRNILKYEFHHQTPTVDEFRKVGKGLSGLNCDKWNPSDIYYIAKGYEQTLRGEVSKCKKDPSFGIIKLNQLIGQNINNVVGISLKDDDGAYQGKISINTLSKLLNYKSCAQYPDQSFDSFDDQYKQFLIDRLQYLYSKDKNREINLVFKRGVEDITQSFEHNKNEKLSTSYFKSIPRVVNFFVKAMYNEKHGLTNLAQKVYIIGSSQTSLSCNHFKVLYDHYKVIEPNENQLISDIKLDDVYIVLCNSIHAYINITVRGQQYKLQVRTFGGRASSPPQFAILPGHFNANSKGFYSIPLVSSKGKKALQ